MHFTITQIVRLVVLICIGTSYFAGVRDCIIYAIPVIRRCFWCFIIIIVLILVNLCILSYKEFNRCIHRCRRSNTYKQTDVNDAIFYVDSIIKDAILQGAYPTTGLHQHYQIRNVWFSQHATQGNLTSEQLHTIEQSFQNNSCVRLHNSGGELSGWSFYVG